MTSEALIRLGTRGSPLALAQTQEVRRRLAAAMRRVIDLLITSDNTFGTPREDAFRRDFNVQTLRHGNCGADDALMAVVAVHVSD